MEVVGVVLFVGGAWVVLDRLGTLPAIVAMLVARFRRRGLWAIPIISIFFAEMGALENMQEEIIPLVPALLLLGRGLGVNATAVMAMSVGAAAIGSAFGPTNPFQAGIAMKLAQLPPMSAAPLRWTTLAAGLTLWVAWTMWWAARNRERNPGSGIGDSTITGNESAVATGRDYLVFAVAVAPLAAYVYGSLARGWGFNEMSGGFIIAGCVAGKWAGHQIGQATFVQPPRSMSQIGG